jgi:hypothetical protein
MDWSQVEKRGPGGCWVWTGKTIKGGYGDLRVKVDGRWRHVIAHRLAWVETNGEIPDGLFVLHRCDNPPCVNPDHLFLGTHRDNMSDMMEKERRATKKGTANGRCKLTPGEVDVIRRLVNAEGVGVVAVAGRFGLATKTTRKIALGLSWPHVPMHYPPRAPRRQRAKKRTAR